MFYKTFYELSFMCYYMTEEMGKLTQFHAEFTKMRYYELVNKFRRLWENT